MVFVLENGLGAQVSTDVRIFSLKYATLVPILQAIALQPNTMTNR